eukprot:snap_masked-scaffold_25-processed-gene-4.31-mRNA-1 protein AED:1.00 eAED:1.00 QI:0/-1/0/0/-1/1/1/0/74
MSLNGSYTLQSSVSVHQLMETKQKAAGRFSVSKKSSHNTWMADAHKRFGSDGTKLQRCNTRCKSRKNYRLEVKS